MNTRVNVIDVECTCWINEPKPMGMEQEIIEIGIAQINLKTMKIDKSEAILVKPTLSTIGPSCTYLTSLTNEMVQDAPTFVDAVEYMKKEYASEWNFWASYGDFDRVKFEKQCQMLNIKYPLCNQHINIKAVIRSVFPNVRGLESALKELNMKFEGRPHRGIDDAINIANLYLNMINAMRERLSYGPETRL